MGVSVHAISDSNALSKIESAWNALTTKHSNNPFLLSGFVKQYMEFNHSKGWTPLVLTMSVGDKLVFASSLKTGNKLGVRFATFLSKSWLSPDFIVDNQYRETCMEHFLDFLFNTLHCQIADLILPAESLNLQVLKQKCKAKSISFFTIPAIGHMIIPVNRTWDEFRNSRTRNFRRTFKRIEQKISQAGLWKITSAEKGDNQLDVVEKIFDVEKMSWKEEWRAHTGKKDTDLLMILAGSQRMAEIEPSFKWDVWFLELNNQTLAYWLVIQYKDVAYLAKTSYDKRYERFSPGICVLNAVIRELFNGPTKKVDFLTELPYMEIWTDLRMPRVRVVMSKSSALLTFIRFPLSTKAAKGILHSLSKKAPFIAKLLDSYIN
jgi:hypothetical protein